MLVDVIECCDWDDGGWHAVCMVVVRLAFNG